jgi:hypothetical protein
VFDRALPLAEQGGKRALATEASDDPLGGIQSFFHGSHSNEFFVICQVAAERGRTTSASAQGFDGMGVGYFRADTLRNGLDFPASRPLYYRYAKDIVA